MNDAETIELIQIIRALRLESVNRQGKIVWNRADWEKTYLGIAPVVEVREEVEA